jgi:sulfur-oxidizing protein SoxB
MDRREFLVALALAGAHGSARGATASVSPALYDLPPARGAACLLHLTDCHAQLLPAYLREAEINIAVGGNVEQLAHLNGEALLRHYRFARGSREAYAFASPDFAALARKYGRMGGFAHLATLVARLKAQRPGAILVDGGDNWQGSACALWTRADDMAGASARLGVELMTGHWEFTLGEARVLELAKALEGDIEFLAQNVFTRDFGDRVFPSHSMREINGLNVAIIGQAYPYTPIANPRHLIPEWTFGIHEQPLQGLVHEVRKGGADAVVLLSHNGVDVDLKLASRVRGIDAILGGHTHDPMPRAVGIRNAGGRTLVTNAGSYGKFLGVLDLRPKNGRIECDYRLLPVFSDLLAPDPEMAALVEQTRQPFAQELAQPLAHTDDLLYRRGNFNGSFDEIILDALRETQEAPVALSPGFRWGTALLPGQTITLEDVMAQTAITYAGINVREMTGAELRGVLEDVADNLFNPDPYYRQGGDMVRTSGLTYACRPRAAMGKRIDDLRIGGSPVQADKRYRIAGWASVQPLEGEPVPVWDIVCDHLRRRGRVRGVKVNTPRLA